MLYGIYVEGALNRLKIYLIANILFLIVGGIVFQVIMTEFFYRLKVNEHALISGINLLKKEVLVDVNYLAQAQDLSKLKNKIYELAQLSSKDVELRVFSSNGHLIYAILKKGDNVQDWTKNRSAQFHKKTKIKQKELSQIKNKLVISLFKHNLSNREENKIKMSKKILDEYFIEFIYPQSYLENFLMRSENIEMQKLVTENTLINLLSGVYYQRIGLKKLVLNEQVKLNHQSRITLKHNIGGFKEDTLSIIFVFGLFYVFLILIIFCIYKKIHKQGMMNNLYYKFIDDFFLFSLADENGKIYYVNDNFVKTSGYTRDELIGRDHLLFDYESGTKDFLDAISDLLYQNRVWKGEIKHITKDGMYYWVNSVISPIKNSSGRIVGFGSVKLDITEEKKIKDEINEKKELLVKSFSLVNIGKMSIALSHQYSTPIAIISTSLEILKLELVEILKKNKTANEQIHQIETTLFNMRELASNLKILGRTSQQENIEEEFVRFNDVLSEFEQMRKSQLMEADVNVNFDLDISEDVFIHGNKVLLTQIFINLFGNSLYEAKKYEEFEIWMEYEMTKENLVISFNDSGNGIPAEVRGKIFDPFFSTKDLSEGTGIGLVLAKDILTRYGGDIYLDTKRKNTCFKIKFKLQKGVVTGE